MSLMSVSAEQLPTDPITQQVVRLFLCGDVMTGRGIDQILPHPCDQLLHENYVKSARDYVRLAEEVNGLIPRAVKFSYIWGAALQELTRVQPDARIVNLETSITRRGAFVPKGINYRMSPENAVCLVSADIDCCVLANNHILDWGHAGLFDTLENLERLRIESAGAGLDIDQASAPAVLDLSGGGRILVFSVALETSGVPVTWVALMAAFAAACRSRRPPSVTSNGDNSLTTQRCIHSAIHERVVAQQEPDPATRAFLRWS
jgi:poly-gamma-glutamate capsule biosynthesis protein CapA/YwtB (metallophosphatase superfamily)